MRLYKNRAGQTVLDGRYKGGWIIITKQRFTASIGREGDDNTYLVKNIRSICLYKADLLMKLRISFLVVRWIFSKKYSIEDIK